MSDCRTPYDGNPKPLSVETEAPSHTMPRAAVQHPSALIADEAWDVFELDEDTIEPEPEHGDFWGELDEDEMI